MNKMRADHEGKKFILKMIMDSELRKRNNDQVNAGSNQNAVVLSNDDDEKVIVFLIFFIYV